MAETYHVYVDFQSRKVMAVRKRNLSPFNARALETLWSVMAENADDAFRKSVTKGLVQKRIDQVEKERDRHWDLIDDWIAQPGDGTGMPYHVITLLRGSGSMINKHLADLAAIEKRYAVTPQ